MATNRKWLAGLAGVGLLAVCIVLFALTLRTTPLPVATGQQPEETVTDTVPTAVATQIPPTSALSTVTVVPTAAEGDDALISLEETPTPIPTFPPPTHKPSPTATPFPWPTPAENVAGTIQYATLSEDRPEGSYSHFLLPFNQAGDAEAEPELIEVPKALDFVPNKVFISPTRPYRVYMQPVEPGGRPYIYHQSTGAINGLFENDSGGSFYGWHPDGRRFLFWIDSVGLWLVDAETLETTPLASPQGPVQGAAISPDGLTIAYIAEDRLVRGALWFVSAAGRDAQPQFDAGDIAYLYPSAWSPDNTTIVYSGNCTPPVPKGEPQLPGPLCLFNLEKQAQVPLSIPWVGLAPVWSPDSRYIAATGLAPGEEECEDYRTRWDPTHECLYQAHSIYLVDTQTGNVSPLTEGIAPTWSPDGSRIAFLSNRSGAPEVWTVHPEGSDLRQMTTDGHSKVPYLNYLVWRQEVK
jgi:Tol biopolymer transport system component